MKQVYIVIRLNKYYKTKDALAEHNFFSLSSKEVLGRGRNGVDFISAEGSEAGSKIDHPFVAKRLIEIFCRDEDLYDLIEVVKSVNQTGNPGDGKIFVIDVEDGIRIRTGETGVNAIM